MTRAPLVTDRRTAIVQVDHLSKSFPSADGSTITVLDDVSFTLYEGEVVALRGKSGSGNRRHCAPSPG